MIPFGNETVTLIKRVEKTVDGRTQVSYRRHVLSGCSWRRRTVWQRYDVETIAVEEITCRIPSGQTMPAAGDALFLGEISGTIADSKTLANAIEKYRATGACRIDSVADYTRPGMPMPHYAARGS